MSAAENQKKKMPWPVLLFALLLSGCVTRQDQTVSRNKEVIHRYFDQWANHGDTSVADAVIATNLVLRNPPAVVTSLEAYKQSMAKFHAAFPDLRFTLEDQIAEGDRIVVRWSMRGTNTGEFQGKPATGKAISVTGTSTFRLAGGRIREIWVNMDRLGLMEQLGWLPAK